MLGEVSDHSTITVGRCFEIVEDSGIRSSIFSRQTVIAAIHSVLVKTNGKLVGSSLYRLMEMKAGETKTILLNND